MSQSIASSGPLRFVTIAKKFYHTNVFSDRLEPCVIYLCRMPYHIFALMFCLFVVINLFLVIFYSVTLFPRASD